MGFLRAIQLDVMVFMGGACGVLSFMTMITKSLPKNTKRILASMEIAAMLLLLFDRYAYLYEGSTTRFGSFMVRLSNGLEYFLLILLPFLLTRYLADVYIREGKTKRAPRLLFVCDVLVVIGTILLFIAPFAKLYYTFDAENHYQRAPGHFLCYVIPFLVVLIQETVIVVNRKQLPLRYVRSLFISIALPTVASVIQIFFYGVSLTNMTMVLIVIIFHTFALNYISETAERARQHELEVYKEQQKKESEMFEETTEALANAVDAKDKYTSGHSLRVAYYSRLIAKEAHLPEKTCEQIYFAALLHDVGKIGVPLEIINKIGKLTDEEYEQMKQHPVFGDQILSSIHLAPDLAVGARSHHERYDGRGYPDGLVGEEIPEIARVIAVADAYDAMTSYRSYRSPLDKHAVRNELKKGIGTQFDPTFARIMLRLMDDGYDSRTA